MRIAALITALLLTSAATAAPLVPKAQRYKQGQTVSGTEYASKWQSSRQASLDTPPHPRHPTQAKETLPSRAPLVGPAPVRLMRGFFLGKRVGNF